MSTPVVYPNFKLKQNNGSADHVDLDTATIKVMILTASYVYNAADEYIDDISANEVSGTNYTAGGTAISGVTFALDGANAEWIHADITWTQHGSGFANGRSYAWYKDTGTPATSPLIMRMTESADFGNTGGDLVLDSSATTGVLNVT